jgi:glutathione S-transferase
LASRLELLEEREKTLQEWLAEEQPSQPDLAMAGGVNGGTPLGTFLRGILADGKPHVLKELATMAKDRGLLKDGAMPGRAVHFALVGLSQHDHAERRKDGTWVKK